MKSKSKLASALLAIFLGDFGAHKFYLGRPGMGILYLLFFWTGIPAVIGIIEGILYLLQSEETFQEKHGRR
ncbi:TM2 domain-containing protein [Planococcus sp. ISL-110]|uniref:TM2 domain-containing protein n=1 Tax=Planococcus sp. ISL-110 TaxID=2819167 RepID=UPI001BECBC9C|nr:TM2 domain-containing protein [Planococcus sp. ISL-110]MBT2569615.1 TM2 domain-containing protein [Planococcus sp. ISL-110]